MAAVYRRVLAVLGGLAAAAAFLRVAGVRRYVVEGRSMLQAFAPGDRVLVEDLTYRLRAPRGRGGGGGGGAGRPRPGRGPALPPARAARGRRRRRRARRPPRPQARRRRPRRQRDGARRARLPRPPRVVRPRRQPVGEHGQPRTRPREASRHRRARVVQVLSVSVAAASMLATLGALLQVTEEGSVKS